jgi:hypothetical protein
MCGYPRISGEMSYAQGKCQSKKSLEKRSRKIYLIFKKRLARQIRKFMRQSFFKFSA